MSKRLDRDGYRHKEKPYRENYKQLLKNAKSALGRTQFAGLADVFGANNPEAAVVRAEWNSDRVSRATEMPGLPNSVGVVISWGRQSALRRIGDALYEDISFKVVVIIANPFGNVSVKGAEVVGRPYQEWQSDTAEQRNALGEALRSPALVTITRPAGASS